MKRILIILLINLHFLTVFSSEELNARIIVPECIPKSTFDLPVVLEFPKNIHGFSNVNQAFNLIVSCDTINQYSIDVKGGKGSVSISINPIEDFKISIPELGLIKTIRVLDPYPTIELTGTLNHNRTLSKDTIYYIQKNLLIDYSTNLHIQSGTIVRLDSASNIIVHGNIQIAGTNNDPVIFTNNGDHGWGGIILDNNLETQSFQNCFITNGGCDTSKLFGHSASQPVVLLKNSTGSFESCYIIDNEGKAFGSIDSKISITNSLISRCDTGGEFINSVCTVDHSTICEIPDADNFVGDDDNDGIYFNGIHKSGNSSSIKNTIISTIEDDGIDHNGANLVIENCRISDVFHEGIACSNKNHVTIFNSLIYNCDQGIESGYGTPMVTIDHCVILNCNVGLRFGDNYNWGSNGIMRMKNSIIFGNIDNIRNFDILSNGAKPNNLIINYSLTNDPEYDNNDGCLVGKPVFDENFFLVDGSPGKRMALDGNDLGLIDNSDSFGIKEFFIECDPADFSFIHKNFQENIYVPITISHRGKITKGKMRIRGDGTRVHPKKSLKVKLDNEAVLDNRSVFNFNAEYEDKSYIQAFLTSTLMKECGIACFDSEHVILHLNNEFLGIFLLVENMDEDFLTNRGLNANGSLYKATKDGASLNNYDNVYYHWEKKTGEPNRDELINFIDNLNRLPSNTFYPFVQENIHYENLTSFIAANLLTRNHSTYYHNYYLYRDSINSKKWRIFPWDLDKTFLYYEDNYPYHRSSKPWVSDNPLLEESILDQQVFQDIKNKVDSIYNCCMNDSFVSPIIDSLQIILQPFIEKDISDNISGISEWESKLLKGRKAFDIRFEKLNYQFDKIPSSFRILKTQRRFDSGQRIQLYWQRSSFEFPYQIKYDLTIHKQEISGEKIEILHEEIRDTTYIISNGMSSGKYIWSVVINLPNHPLEGYNNYNEFFVSPEPERIIINEINYNSSHHFDVGDWVELYNDSDDLVDMSNWVLSDNNDSNYYIFPQNTIIEPHGYRVFCSSINKFSNHYPSVSGIIGDIGFSFDNSEDLIRLKNSYGLIVDSVGYNDKLPWPISADGIGHSLQLTDPANDNSIPMNWHSSWDYGSPGEINPAYDSISVTINPFNSPILNYPNPFTHKTTIRIPIIEASTLTCEIYNINGKLIERISRTISKPGIIEEVINAENYPIGMYYCSIIIDFENIGGIKMIKASRATK